MKKEATTVPTNAKAGDKITYTFTVENIGSVTVTDVKINAGKFENTATVTGKDPRGNDVSDDSDDPTKSGTDDPTVTTFTPEPKLDLKKEATTVPSKAKAGDKITYTFTVENTGNVTVKGVKINDAKIGVTDLTVTPSDLVPGTKGTATATYTLKQADIDAGKFENTATATGKDPKGKEVSDDSDDPTKSGTDDPTVTIFTPEPKLDLKKEGVFVDKNGNGRPNVGDVIKYTFTVTNTGAVTVKDININDAKIGLTDVAITPSDLKPNETGSVTKEYVLTAKDIKAGKIVNTATAVGKDPNGKKVEDTSDSTNPKDDDGKENNQDKDGDATNDPTVTELGNTTDASDDVNVTDMNTPVKGNVLDNDTDAEGHNQKVTDYTQPNNGKVVVNPDGTYTYTPNKGFVGVDTFTYTICDDGTPQACDEATVTITIKSVDVKTEWVDENGKKLLEPVLDKNGQPKKEIDCYEHIRTVTDENGNVRHIYKKKPFSKCDCSGITGKDIVIYNEFSPNEDGINDFLKIKNIECRPNNTLEIFNRWGNTVWKAKGYNNDSVRFEGISNQGSRAVIYQSDKLPVGTYYYILNLGEGSDIIKGWIYINR